MKITTVRLLLMAAVLIVTLAGSAWAYSLSVERRVSKLEVGIAANADSLSKLHDKVNMMLIYLVWPLYEKEHPEYKKPLPPGFQDL